MEGVQRCDVGRVVLVAGNHSYFCIWMADECWVILARPVAVYSCFDKNLKAYATIPICIMGIDSSSLLD